MTDGKRPTLTTHHKSSTKKYKSAISAHNNKKNKGNKNLSISRILSDTVDIARSKNEGNTCIYSFNNSLPHTQLNYLDPESNKSRIPLRLPQWRDTPIQLQTCFYQLAMAETEQNTEKELIPFVFLLSQELTKSAQKNKDTNAQKNKAYAEVSYIRKRLIDSLRRSLTRSIGDEIDLWFSLEFAMKNNRGYPHIQGSILLYPQEHKEARKAFYKLNKIYTDGDPEKDYWLRYRDKKRKALFLERGQLATDLNWASYNTKELGSGKVFFTRDTTNTAATQKLKTHAKSLYGDLLQIRLDEQNNTSAENIWGSW